MDDAYAGAVSVVEAHGYDELAALSKLLAAAEDLDELLERAADRMLALLDAASCSISRWERRTGLLRTMVNTGELLLGEVRRPLEETYRVAAFPAVLRFDQHSPGVVARLDDGACEPGQRALLEATGRTSSLSLPITVDGRTWGEIYLARDDRWRRYDHEDLPFARALASVVSAWVAQAGRLGLVRRLAYEDPLTGLANRRAVDDRLDAAFADARLGRRLALLVCDVNGLKAYNDELGHDSGDKALLTVAAVLSASSAAVPGALAGRIGGDEFCVVVPHHEPGACELLADELADRAREMLPDGLGLACGLACTEHMPTLPEAPSRVFRLADAAQYRAKRTGSAGPVVAGRSVLVPFAEGVPMPRDPAEEVPARERRTLRARGRTLACRLVSAVLTDLDGLAGGSALARLTVVAERVAAEVDAAGWWVSRVAPGSDTVETVACTVARDPRTLVAAAAPPGQVGERYPLAAFPLTAAAVAGGSWTVVVGEPGTDPAEEAFVVSGGYTGSAAAGATVDGTGWLVEVYADDLSTPLDGVADLLRALVAAALMGCRSGARLDVG